MDEANVSEEIINAVFNKGLQMICEGQWLNDNLSTKKDCVIIQVE